MNTRHNDDKGAMEKLGARVRQRAMSGTEASTVGFVLVLYIFAGAGLGYLADGFFETNWIVAAGVLGGAALGFREMFRLIKKVTRVEVEETTARQAQERSTPEKYSPPRAETAEPPETTHAKPRYFDVPPPPQSEFGDSDKKPR